MQISCFSEINNLCINENWNADDELMTSHSLRKEAATCAGLTAVDTPVSLSRQQQGEQAAAAVAVVFTLTLYVILWRSSLSVLTQL